MHGHPPQLGTGEQLRPEPGTLGGGASFAGLRIRRRQPAAPLVTTGLGAENGHQATKKSMSYALNFHPGGDLEAIVKFLDLGNLTMLAKVREIVRKAKLDVHFGHVVSMN